MEEKSKEVQTLEEEVKSLKEIIKFLGEGYDEKGPRRTIDFKKLFEILWVSRKTYLKVLTVAFILVAVYALSIPDYYECEVRLSPELSGNKGSNSLTSLASSFGVKLGSGVGGATDALFPTLYPELMNSVDFKTSLFPVKVTIEGDKVKGEPDLTMSYYDYLKDYQKFSWVSVVAKALLKLFGWVKSLFTTVPEPVEGAVPNPFRLTKEQSDIVKAIDEKIVCDVDNKTMMITINVTDQNPVICATMADSVKKRLQTFITEYRTSKARVDLEYNRKICVEAKARYEQARKRYAGYSDGNQRVFLESVRSQKDALEHEMQLQYNAYQQVASQLLTAEAKVQEETPAFTTLKSATVPLEKSGPKRAQICLAFLFLAFLATSAWILYTSGEYKSLVKKVV